MVAEPSPTESNGRGEGGKFVKGNRIAKGNPFAKRVAQLRSMFIDTVSLGDYREAVLKMVELAKAGDVAAFKEINDRLFGKAKQPLEVGGPEGKAIKVKATLDFRSFVRELEDVERERSAAAGGMVPPDRN